MIIEGIEKFKSIPKFGPIELPPLTILTGLNGSGKSQLLKALEMQYVRCDLFQNIIPPVGMPGMPPVNMLITAPSVQPGITLLRNWADVDGQFSSERLSALGHRFGNLLEPGRSSPAQMMQFEMKRSHLLAGVTQRLDTIFGGLLISMLAPNEDPWRLSPELLAGRIGIAVADERLSLVLALYHEADEVLKMEGVPLRPEDTVFRAALETARDEFGVTRLAVTQEMIDTLQSRISIQMFQPNITEIFGAYRDRVFSNDMDEIQARRDPNLLFLSTDEFLNKFGPPPWQIATELLSAMSLPFEVIPPSSDMAQPVQFRLRLPNGGDELAFADLSSGEQVLLRFALSVMRPNPTMAGLQRPKLLLLDEMDASLHPEMVQRWLGAIERGIVGDLGINVILTTHSPTTVALAPDNAIYAMTEGRPQRVSKQDAINKLTFGVPALSIDFSGRRQVFCESDTDAAIFEKVYAAVKPQLILAKELNFIGTGIRDKSKVIKTGEGEEINAGEAVVRQIVANMASLSVNSVFGLIDWDGKAIPTERVKVIGEGAYYTIENILLDPVLIGSLMVLDRMPISGLALNPRAFGELDVSILQQLADIVQNAIVLPDDDGSQMTVNYSGGASVRIKRRYGSLNGHHLEELLADEFGPLKRYTANRGMLARRISEVVISDYPELCPKVITSAFEAISYSEMLGSIETPLDGRR